LSQFTSSAVCFVDKCHFDWGQMKSQCSVCVCVCVWEREREREILGFELQALNLLGRHSYHLSHSDSLQCSFDLHFLYG
jgi:hypothetical protein